MPAEIYFSAGTRGKFFRATARKNLPVYLDDQVQTSLSALANAQGIKISSLVNDLLKKDIALIDRALNAPYREKMLSRRSACKFTG